MRLSKFFACAAATAGLILILPAPSDAQQAGPSARDHRTTSQPAAIVRDHRKSSPGIVSATGSGVKQGVKKEAGAAVTPVRNVVNTASKAGSGAKDIATGRPIKGAKKLAGVGAELAIAPVRTAVNAGSKVVGGAKKVRKAAKSVAKKLNPFD